MKLSTILNKIKDSPELDRSFNYQRVIGKMNYLECKDAPMKSSTILNKSKDSPEFDRSFNYQSVIGKMNYLEKGSRSELAYVIH